VAEKRAGRPFFTSTATVAFVTAPKHLYGDVQLVQMRTTLNLDDEKIARARDLTGLTKKTALIHAGLDALIARASAQRLAALGGRFPMTRPPRRRRRRTRQ